VTHAFFTREGGVSKGLYQTLNCGYGSDDNPDHVTENRRRAAEALTVDPTHLLTSYQFHSANVVTVDTPWQRADSPKADGMVTARPGIALGILTADCAPVLMADEEAGVIGACHAGWRGAIEGVTEATLTAMENLGARRNRIEAVIGPCIAQKSYQVGAEFHAHFVAEDPANTAFFLADGDRYRFDLAGYVMKRLSADGVSDPQWIGYDNCAEENHLFSYRRSTLAGEPDFGRGLSAIVLTD
jgi:YfiH family protein